MPQGPYSRIVVERADGRIEVLSRPGIISPQDAAVSFARRGCKVTAVRHEHVAEGQKKPQTLGIHRV